MERDVEFRPNGHLYEIASVNDEVLGSRQGVPGIGGRLSEDAR